MADAPLDLALGSRALEGAGKDVPDKRLTEMSALAAAGDYAAAARHASEALAEGVTDIRVLGYFWLGVFLEQGPEGIAPVLSAAAAALDRHFEALRPAVRRERVTDGALAFLLRTIVSRVDFHEAMRDTTFRLWLSKSSPELAASARAKSRELRGTIERVIEKSRAIEQLSELENRLETIFSRTSAPAAPPKPKPTPPPVEEQEATEAEQAEEGWRAEHVEGDEADDEGEEAVEQPRAEPRRSPGVYSARAASASPPQGARMIEVSPALEDFLQKLAAFEQLIERGDMTKAAVVAEDVRRVVESFDPRVYLPKLLAPHFRLLASHVEELSPFWEGMDSPQWRALEQLYRVDLEAFVGDGEEPM